jgi:hypothetical protein
MWINVVPPLDKPRIKFTRDKYVSINKKYLKYLKVMYIQIYSPIYIYRDHLKK